MVVPQPFPPISLPVILPELGQSPREGWRFGSPARTAPETCDAAVIGAGADGLVAASVLGRAGLKVIVIERTGRPGGQLVTREFHPGFRASAFVDEVAPVPPPLHWALDLSRRGAIFSPSPGSVALWSDRHHVIGFDHAPPGVLTLGAQRANQALHRAEQDAGRRSRWRGWISRDGETWRSQDLSATSLRDIAADHSSSTDETAHVIARATAGRAVEPSTTGSGLHLLAPGLGTSGTIAGGVGRLGDALANAAIEAGAAIRYGVEASEIRLANKRVLGVVLPDGTRIRASAVVSTLDLKRTFLSLFRGADLPGRIATRITGWRMNGATARLLFALSRPPMRTDLNPQLLRGPIYVAPDEAIMAKALAAWRAQMIPEAPPIALRAASAIDPSLAPLGAATLTATVGCIPYRPLNDAWSYAKRDHLRHIVTAQIERVIPGFAETVLACDVLVPPDIEEQLGATGGDLWGGEIAPDQMLGMRPDLPQPAPRTFLRGLYLAGKSTPAGPLATGAAGAVAARAVLADLGRR